MSAYERLKWIESPDGRLALEVLRHPLGHAQFVVHQRSPERVAVKRGEWTAVQNSGVYPDPDSAERDGLAQWDLQSTSYFGGMTTNERLSAADLLDPFDQATARRDRADMIAILEKVELGDQAARIADTVLARPRSTKV